MRYFHWSILITVLGIITAFLWGGIQALLIVLMLSALEVSLSFDNAVVNASVLKTMSPVWQKRFLLWGILIAVFGVRFILPILIVDLVTPLGFIEVFKLALYEPKQYAHYLHQAHLSISAFGGMFLLMVFFTFMFNHHRNIHWLVAIEKRITRIGKLESVELVIGLIILLIFSLFVPETKRFQVLTSGIIGLVLYVSITMLTALLAEQRKYMEKTGFSNFLYLEILDASFSLDGVIGAFAISKEVVIVFLGLAIGAFFVRSLTIFLVHEKTLEKYLFLEHGAHYAIGALGSIMLISMIYPVPELITGFIGIVFIIAALFSSIRHNRKKVRLKRY